MPRAHCTIAVSLFLGGVLAVETAGCGQSVPSDEPRAIQDANDEAAERQASYDERPDEGSNVEQTSAESRIEPPRPANAPADDKADDKPADNAPGTLAAADAPLPLDDVKAADLTMPQVSLTEHHAATCLVDVGDAFPDLKLSDPSGTSTSLADHFGPKLTLVVFWHAQEPNALEQLADLARYHQPRFGDGGLSIVAVNTGDQPQLAGELAKEAGAKFTVLCDPDASAFKQVATEKLPRSYLLDASGKILWFDLEYAPTTRRDLVQAIRYSLER